MDSQVMNSRGVCLTGTEALQEAERAKTRVIRVAGNLCDTVVIKRLDEAATRCVQAGRGRVVLDLDAVEDADTRLVAELVRIVGRAIKAGVGLQIRASERIRHWITLYRLDRLLSAAAESQYSQPDIESRPLADEAAP